MVSTPPTGLRVTASSMTAHGCGGSSLFASARRSARTPLCRRVRTRSTGGFPEFAEQLTELQPGNGRGETFLSAQSGQNRPCALTTEWL